MWLRYARRFLQQQFLCAFLANQTQLFLSRRARCIMKAIYSPSQYFWSVCSKSANFSLAVFTGPDPSEASGDCVLPQVVPHTTTRDFHSIQKAVLARKGWNVWLVRTPTFESTKCCKMYERPLRRGRAAALGSLAQGLLRADSGDERYLFSRNW